MIKLCVFCGSRPGRQEVYLDTAKMLGEILVDRGIGLVYGAASVGVMGAVADSVLQNGGQVVGVIPKFLTGTEVVHEYLTELHVVNDMHERKALMGDLSDAFLALPGGFGTFEELLEVITWNQLGIHDKPVGLLNVQGYFDLLDQFLEHAVSEDFISVSQKLRLIIDTDCNKIVDLIFDSSVDK